MDKDRNSTKKIIFIKKARKFFDKQIKKEENKQKRQLTNAERKENRKKNHKKARLIATVAASVALGMVGGSEGRHLLDSRHTIEVEDKKENSVTIDSKKIEKSVSVNNARNVFVNGLYIGEEQLEVVKNMNQDLEINTLKEVKMLANETEKISKYIKTIYADEYNQTNGTNITNDDITINREKIEVGIEATDENVKRIKEEAKERGDYSITIRDGIIKDRETMEMTIIVDNGEYHDEIEVPYTRFDGDPSRKGAYTPEALATVKSLPVIDQGLEWIECINRGSIGSDTNIDFYHTVIQYKKSKMNEIATEYMQIDNENEGTKKENQDEITDDGR